MEAEMNQLKDKADQYEKKIQELEQQKEEVVRMAVSLKYFLPGTHAEGVYVHILEWLGGCIFSINFISIMLIASDNTSLALHDVCILL